MTTAEKLRHEGKVEGKREGKIEGKREGKVEVAAAMLARGVDRALISDVTGLSDAELAKLK